MDERYREIYREIYEARTQPGLPHERRAAYARMTLRNADADVLRKAIEAAERQVSTMGLRLREDARALLAVNFEDLVILPLQQGRESSRDVYSDSIFADVQLLVSDAAVEAQTEPYALEEEVSGHLIINALSRNWRRLRITRLNLWESDVE